MMSTFDEETSPTSAQYAAGVIASRLEHMLSEAGGVLQGEDVEPVHQMRVWSRRTRAALDVFEPCFAGRRFKALRRKVKLLTRALGAARDLDVMIGALSKQASSLPVTERAGIDAFIDDLRARRRSAQEEVEQTILNLEQADLRRKFTEMLVREGVALPPGGAHEE
jgi:CHAD domain-containing protein